MTSADIRAKIATPEVLKMVQIMDGLQIGFVNAGRVVVEPVQAYTEYDEINKRGLIYVPDAAKEDARPQPSTGIIIKCGEGVPAEFGPGTMVAFSRYSGMRFAVDKKDLIILQVADIAMTLEAVEGKALGDLVMHQPPNNLPDVPALNGRPSL